MLDSSKAYGGAIGGGLGAGIGGLLVGAINRGIEPDLTDLEAMGTMAVVGAGVAWFSTYWAPANKPRPEHVVETARKDPKFLGKLDEAMQLSNKATEIVASVKPAPVPGGSSTMKPVTALLFAALFSATLVACAPEKAIPRYDSGGSAAECLASDIDCQVIAAESAAIVLYSTVLDLAQSGRIGQEELETIVPIKDKLDFVLDQLAATQASPERRALLTQAWGLINQLKGML